MNALFRKGLILVGLFLINAAALADSPLGQTIQIYTQFRHFEGKPTWTLIIRDVDTGLVSPYVFDFRNKENYWVAFTFGHNYRVTASNLRFGTFAEIPNFCGLENGILSGTSLFMTLSGVLTPDVKTSKCFVHKYKNASFTIVNEN
jgi:hypothetical protein